MLKLLVPKELTYLTAKYQSPCGIFDNVTTPIDALGVYGLPPGLTAVMPANIRWASVGLAYNE